MTDAPHRRNSRLRLLLAAVVGVVALPLGLFVVEAAASPPVISAVGTLATRSGPGITTLSTTPRTVGDAMLLAIKVSSATTTVSSVSGGGATSWTKVIGYQDATSHDVELWLGPITSTGTSTITVTFSSGVSGVDVDLGAQEFTAGLGSSTVWTKDVAAGQSNASSTTISYPSLTPTSSGELYFGYSRSPILDSPGNTAGFTYEASADGNMVTFNTNVSSRVAPTSSQSTANPSSAVGALVSAS